MSAQYYRITRRLGTPHRNSVTVTIPLVGPQGPAGPQGEQGPPGEVSGSLAWDNVTDKPTTFPPSSHTHVAADITDFTSAVEAVSPPADWDTLANKPSTFPPSSHGHVAADVSDFSTAAAAAAPVQSVAGRTGAISLAVADVANAVADTDARLSDDRNPLSHASSHAAGIAAKVAFFNGRVGGMTADVVIAADNAGEDGNNITLSFNGTDDIETVLDAWSAANESNTASRVGGDLSQVPNNGEEIILSGGENAAPAGSDPIYDQDLNTDNAVTFEQTKITKLAPNEIGPRLILDNTAGFGEGAIDFYTIDGQGGPDTNNPSARWYLVDDGDYSAHQYFQTKENGDSGTEMITRLAVRTDGNVGIGVEEPTTTLDVAGNMALRDTDNEFAATFDVQSQLTADVTLTIPDQSGTLATTDDIVAPPDASSATPQPLGSASAGSSDDYSRGDHVHAAPALNDLSNVSAATPSDNDVLTFDTATGNWVAEAAAAGGVSAIGTSAADVFSVSGSDLVADDGNTIDGADPFIKWDDTAGKLVYANPLSRPTGSFYVGLAPTTTALGNNAVYISPERTAETQVASANNTVCIGPRATASSLQAVAIGWQANASGASSIAINRDSAASGEDSVALSRNAIASSGQAVAIGRGARAQAINTVAIGRDAITSLRSEFSTRPFNAIYWGGTTTNDSATILNLDETATNRFTIAANTALAVDILLVARRSDTADKWLVARRFLGIRRDGSNNTSLIGSVQTLGTDQSDGSPTWSFALTADDTNEALQLEVTGAASETVQWRATAFYRVV
jgi:hypothetical protein